MILLMILGAHHKALHISYNAKLNQNITIKIQNHNKRQIKKL